MAALEPDFRGWATKHNIKCSDGKTILQDAFKHQHKMKVPLVWQHQHDNVGNVLGHAYLENRPEGVYTYAFFNDTEDGQKAKAMVQHKDVESLSIFANGLKYRTKGAVSHGDIREVSLVMAGANPGALIEHVALAHGDGTYTDVEDEAVIFTGLGFETDNELELEHADNSGGTVADNTTTDQTVEDIFNSMTEEQQNVAYYLAGLAVENAGGDTASHSDLDEDDEETISAEEFLAHIDNRIQEGFETIMTGNLFENAAGAQAGKGDTSTLSHSQVEAIFADAKKGSLKDAVLAHAGDYGIDNIDILFPDAKLIGDNPQILGRRTAWATKVISGVKKSPFSRVKSVVADITADEARARGYVTGNLKKDEVIKLLKRKTEPTTIYKKQKLDRDDILDITDLDIVPWIKGEMRVMLDEEIARAILLGDGRSEASDDKVNEERIRPIATDDDFYAHKHTLTAALTIEDQIDELIIARSHFRGSGTPTLFSTLPYITKMLLSKDKVGRRYYNTLADLASALMVDEIVEVEVMEQYTDLVAIFVNLNDYTVGADKGGEVSMFDDFDIDYNQQKYLMEARMSGALTKPKSAIVVRRPAGTSATPVSPNFNGATNTITIPTTDGVDYLIDNDVVTGSQVITWDTQVDARPKDGYSFADGTVAHWTFVYTDPNA